MRYGSLQGLLDDRRGMLMGEPLAAHLGLLPGDTVALVISEPGPAGVTPRILRYRVAGLFEVGAELDYSLVVVAIRSLPEGRLDAMGVGRAGLRRRPAGRAGSGRAAAAAHPGLNVTSWADSYGELFQAVRLEKLMMFLILLMVVAVAAFNIVSGQTMAVADKRCGHRHPAHHGRRRRHHPAHLPAAGPGDLAARHRRRSRRRALLARHIGGVVAPWSSGRASACSRAPTSSRCPRWSFRGTC
jgi:hypothetical protein